MKNSIYKIVVATVLLLFSLSCEDALEPQVFNQINASDFPQTEADVLAALIPFYAQFNQDYGNNDPTRNVFTFNFNAHFLGYSWATSVQTDEAFDIFFFPESTFTFGPATYDTNSGLTFYDRVSYVARMTGLIDIIEKSEIPNKELYIAETKALRGWFMYVLYDFYGPVSVRLDPTTLADETPLARPTKEDYVAAMVQDLEDAIEGLPEKYNGTSDWGRASKGVASILLMKVHMHEKNWAEAKEVGESIMNMGYNLNPSYKNVFTEAQNNEIIFAVPGNLGTGNIWFACILPGDAKSVLGVDVTQGAKYKLNEMPWSFYDTYSDGDMRLETIANEYINNDDNVIGRDNGLTGAIPLKYTDYVPSENEGFDLIMYRYADVILAMAEATNELDGPTSEVQAYVRQITDRANTTGNIPLGAFSSQDEMREFILAERGRELYWEFGIRRQDLIRNNSFISKAQARNLDASDFEVLFPIPANVIIESGGVIEQNPGY
ncbi:RagB/SusD family nutrient uptake outer membrane protein [Costertonia aggregata]|uniref:RagB/SusD family nutrient uptake outer membrane protein n=1 Tax=Costertonia aggregata TaxID=343403 RepID=A0A7H9ANS0_9FLAO|nr:RagB/SusD family nutrient uptake outer membrane protein [Costertonia aggregata]QLG45080.1 RagB/SusD family nutrient uptake outer membrane protein [Costertonia aggregata]